MFYKNQTDLFNYQINCKKRKRLKVLYTCTNLKILTDEYQNRSIESRANELSSTISTPSSSTADDPFVSSEELSSSAEAVSTEQTAKIQNATTTNHFNLAPFSAPSKENGAFEEETEDSNCTTILAKKTALGFISEWIQAVYYVSGNLERLLLYFLVSILFALLCILIVMSCKLKKDKNRVKKCIKQQQLPIFEYMLPDDEDEASLMSPSNTAHFKQLQRQQQLINNALANQETNNNSIQQQTRNTMVLLSNQSTNEPAATRFYSTANQQHLLRSSPTSQINPNYIHPFLNEQELINREEEDDEPIEGGFIVSQGDLNAAERQNLMVSNTIRSSFKNQNLTQLTTKPILIKDHASTIHFIRSSSSRKPSTSTAVAMQTANRIRLVGSSSTLVAQLNGCNQFNNTLTSFGINDERRPFLSSSPNLHPMHVLTNNSNTTTSNTSNSITPTSTCSQNTTTTTLITNATSAASQSKNSPSPKSYSQRTTPQSKNRLINVDNLDNNLNNQINAKLCTLTASLTKSDAVITNVTTNTMHNLDLINSQSPINSLINSPLNSPVNSPITSQNSSSPISANCSTSTASSPMPNQDKQLDQIDLNTPLIVNNNDKNQTINTKKPAWLDEASPIKQNALTNRSFDDKNQFKISSVGDSLLK